MQVIEFIGFKERQHGDKTELYARRIRHAGRLSLIGQKLILKEGSIDSVEDRKFGSNILLKDKRLMNTGATVDDDSVSRLRMPAG